MIADGGLFMYGVKQLLQLIFHDKDIDLQAKIIIVNDGGGGYL